MTDVNQLITEHLGIWTSAFERKSGAGRGNGGGVELYGVKKLRELILELAVRGKLVPQCDSDQPVEKLLSAIDRERASVLSDPECIGKWSKPTGFVERKGDIPTAWQWVALADVINWHVGGGTPSKTRADYWNGGIPWASVKDVGKSKYLDQTIDEISSKGLANSSSNLVPKGSVLVVTRMGLGKLSINEIDVAINQDIRALSVSSLMNLDYCYLFLKTHKMEGAGLTVKGVKVGQLLSVEFPLPPIEEQHRIVAKVDELMALCDALERQTEDSLKAHQTLVETCLAALTNSQSPEDLTQNWGRIEAHFDTLFTTKESISALGQCVIDLAVSGKLSDQRISDSHVGDFFEAVDIAKASEPQKGRSKSRKASERPADKGAFVLPEKWEWAPLSVIGWTFTGGTPKSSDKESFDGEVPFLGPGQIAKDGQILGSDKSLTERGVANSTEALPGDILMVCIGGSIGKSAIVLERCAFNQQINSVRPAAGSSSFFHLVLRSSYFQKVVLERATGSATPIINRSKWEAISVPVPPVEEQERIVARVDELFEFLGLTSSKIITGQALQVQLADTLTSKIH